MTSVFTSRQACRQVDAADSPKFNLERQSDTADTELANTKEDTQMTIEATSVTADTETMTNDGKKIMPADAATSTKDTAMNNSKNNDTNYLYFWRRQWHPTPVLLPGKSHIQRSLVGCSL